MNLRMHRLSLLSYFKLLRVLTAMLLLTISCTCGKNKSTGTKVATDDSSNESESAPDTSTKSKKPILLKLKLVKNSEMADHYLVIALKTPETNADINQYFVRADIAADKGSLFAAQEKKNNKLQYEIDLQQPQSIGQLLMVKGDANTFKQGKQIQFKCQYVPMPGAKQGEQHNLTIRISKKDSDGQLVEKAHESTFMVIKQVVEEPETGGEGNISNEEQPDRGEENTTNGSTDSGNASPGVPRNGTTDTTDPSIPTNPKPTPDQAANNDLQSNKSTDKKTPPIIDKTSNFRLNATIEAVRQSKQPVRKPNMAQGIGASDLANQPNKQPVKSSIAADTKPDLAQSPVVTHELRDNVHTVDLHPADRINQPSKESASTNISKPTPVCPESHQATSTEHIAETADNTALCPESHQATSTEHIAETADNTAIKSSMPAGMHHELPENQQSNIDLLKQSSSSTVDTSSLQHGLEAKANPANNLQSPQDSTNVGVLPQDGTDAGGVEKAIKSLWNVLPFINGNKQIDSASNRFQPTNNIPKKSWIIDPYDWLKPQNAMQTALEILPRPSAEDEARRQKMEALDAAGLALFSTAIGNLEEESCPIIIGIKPTKKNTNPDHYTVCIQKLEGSGHGCFSGVNKTINPYNNQLGAFGKEYGISALIPEAGSTFEQFKQGKKLVLQVKYIPILPVKKEQPHRLAITFRQKDRAGRVLQEETQSISLTFDFVRTNGAWKLVKIME